MLLTDGLVLRDRFALVIVDVQERLAAAMKRRNDVVLATERLARAAALVGAPILVTRQNPDRLGGTVPRIQELLERLQADGAEVREADKTSFCCCEEPSFTEALAATGRAQLVLAGMETHICITQTALALASAGSPVHVVADACCSQRTADHDTALARLRAAGVVVTTSESVMYEAVGSAGTDEFRQLLNIVKSD